MNSWFDNLEKMPNGLALGGGGSRGWYEVGVWQALAQKKIQFDCVAGTSIGALVGAMYVQNSLDEMVSFVRTIEPGDVAQDLFGLPETAGQWVKDRKEIGDFVQKYILSRKGMNIAPLREVIDRMFDYRTFMNSPVNYACMTFNLTRKHGEAYFKSEMTPENAREIILASASCYPAFPVLKMGNDEYIDGGYWDNVPADLAEKMGARKILAIDVEGPGIVLPFHKQTDLFLIKPMLPLGNFLDFDRTSCVKNMAAGRLEMGKLLGLYCGHLYTFESSAQSQLVFWSGYLSFMFAIYHISISEKQTASLNRWTAGYSESDLSAALNDGSSLIELAEDLAWLAGVDAYKIWTVDHFLSVLMIRLNEAAAHPGSVIKGGEPAHRRMVQIAHIRSVLQREGIEKGLRHWASGLVTPGETALALVWVFMERGLKRETTSESQTA